MLSILNDVWMDNGVETLYSILKEIDDPSFKIKIENNSLIVTIENFDDFKKKVGSAFEYIRSNLIVTVMEKELNTPKEVKKDYILIQEGTKIGGKVAFKESLYNQRTVMGTTSNVFDLMIEDGTKNCVICGKSFAKPIKKLQQAAYPFVTKIKSLSGVRSYKNEEGYSLQEYYDDFCPACYLRGIIEWADDAIIYRTSGGKSTLFLPQISKLDELVKFKKRCRNILSKNGRYQNILEEINSNKIEKTSGTFSTLLCFYEKFFVDVQGENSNKSWAIMEIPLGTVKNIKFYTLNIEESILDIMLYFCVDFGLYSGIIKTISFFNNDNSSSLVDWKLTDQKREKLSKAFIENDFYAFSNVFLPQKGGQLGFSNETREKFEKFLYKWRFETMGLNEENFKMLKSAGKTIAVASRSHQSLLYKLDKVKDKSALLDVIRQVSRRIVGLKPEEKEKYKNYIYPLSLEDLTILVETHNTDHKFIEDLRNTLVIFACVESSRLNYFE